MSQTFSDIHDFSPVVRHPSTNVFMSPTFRCDANIDARPPDLVIVTVDQVHFFVHEYRLSALSRNRFYGLLPASTDSDHTGTSRQLENLPVIEIIESNTVSNVLFRVLYDLSFDGYVPPLSKIRDAIAALVKYGIIPSQVITKNSSLAYDLHRLSAHSPLEVYMLAAKFYLNDIATSTSQYLLSVDILNVPDEFLYEMGPVYFKRLVELRTYRINALRSLLPSPPLPHAPCTSGCDYIQREEVVRLWTLVSAFISWNARADFSSAEIEVIVSSSARELTCHMCRIAFRDRGKDLQLQWNLVKVRSFPSSI